jgi:hypothetical protein
MNRGETYYSITGEFVNNKKVIEHLMDSSNTSTSVSKPPIKVKLFVNNIVKGFMIIKNENEYLGRVDFTENEADATNIELNRFEDKSFLTYRNNDKLYILYMKLQAKKTNTDKLLKSVPPIDTIKQNFMPSGGRPIMLELVTDDIMIHVNAKDNKWNSDSNLADESWYKNVLFNSSSVLKLNSEEPTPKFWKPISFEFINLDTMQRMSDLSMYDPDYSESGQVVRTPITSDLTPSTSQVVRTFPSTSDLTSSTPPVNNIQETMDLIQGKIRTLEKERNKCFIDIKTSCPPGYKCIPSNIWKNIAKGVDGMDIMIEKTQILHGDSPSTDVNIKELSN